jgi:hypothetical protein
MLTASITKTTLQPALVTIGGPFSIYNRTGRIRETSTTQRELAPIWRSLAAQRQLQKSRRFVHQLLVQLTFNVQTLDVFTSTMSVTETEETAAAAAVQDATWSSTEALKADKTSGFIIIALVTPTKVTQSSTYNNDDATLDATQHDTRHTLRVIVILAIQNALFSAYKCTCLWSRRLTHLHNLRSRRTSGLPCTVDIHLHGRS